MWYIHSKEYLTKSFGPWLEVINISSKLSIIHTFFQLQLQICLNKLKCSVGARGKREHMKMIYVLQKVVTSDS